MTFYFALTFGTTGYPPDDVEYYAADTLDEVRNILASTVQRLRGEFDCVDSAYYGWPNFVTRLTERNSSVAGFRVADFCNYDTADSPLVVDYCGMTPEQYDRETGADA